MAQAPIAVLLGFEGSSRTALSRGSRALRAAGSSFELEPLFAATRAPAAALGVRAAGARKINWHIARPTRAVAGGSPWDVTREVMKEAAARGLRPVRGEPDLVQPWPSEVKKSGRPAAREGGFQDQETSGGRPVVRGDFAWHLGDSYSGLAAARARARAASDAVIRIAHLDTGYDLDHSVFPRGLIDSAHSRNFTGDGRATDDIRDQIKGGLMTAPGHGTGTLSLLAGGRFAMRTNGYAFNDEIGAAPDARVVGLRVANAVVQIKTSAVAAAIAYAAELCGRPESRVHVLSMSMGGVASQAWADAVNLAYEAGIVLVTAAGNNFSAGFLGGVPATSIVYPARFQRVLAACGVMANFEPYYGLGLRTMQGNWGPRSKRGTSISAFTPNTPWARRGQPQIVDMNGAGTSAATPQVAGAASLYLRYHAEALLDDARYPKRWMVGEAVRRALIASARAPLDGDDLEKLGAGMLHAGAALDVVPESAGQLEPADEAAVSFPFLRVITGLGAKGADPLLELELAQLVQSWDDAISANPFDELIRNVDEQGGRLAPSQQRELTERLAKHPGASRACREVLGRALNDSARPRSGGPKAAAAQPAAPRPVFGCAITFEPPRPRHRELRGYALDPSFAASLSTHHVSETLFSVPWEKTEPGPSDSYIQVMDIDPASGRVYEPIDLEHPHVLASKGLAPSEGTPQFHQQMVYAVARMTIARFESALGRPALWRPGPPRDPAKNPRDDSQFVGQLRIYPHALRDANAYYSPARNALLFGYFGSDAAGAGHERVFTCLSHDVIAHETTHALLDGMHRSYLLDSNPDVLAFHEAFADIVALFQRLTLSDLLRYQIAMTQGQFRTRRSLMGQLATQFGRAIGHRKALREAIGGFDERGEWTPAEPDPAAYEAATEPHERGSVLVSAVFDAFLSIYEKRTEDLLRLATDGTGVLPPGAIHPDLVNRLADEASKAASHVVTMCIRGLDYCPPTDLTFAEYLRAVVTADAELFGDEGRGYRVAFVEGFRKRGIYVSDAPSMSEESVLWRRASDENPGLSVELLDRLADVRAAATADAFSRDRRAIFFRQREVRRDLHKAMTTHFAKSKHGHADASFLGLNPAMPFEVHTARFAMRAGPDGRMQSQAIFGLLQRDPSRKVGGDPFEGGSTVIADLARKEVSFVIRKNVTSESRRERQRAYAAAAATTAGGTYFGVHSHAEPFAALHKPAGDF